MVGRRTEPKDRILIDKQESKKDNIIGSVLKMGKRFREMSRYFL